MERALLIQHLLHHRAYNFLSEVHAEYVRRQLLRLSL